MPSFDDRLTRDLERAARPAAPDPVATFDEVARRRARRTVIRKVQVMSAVVVILAVTAGAFVVLDDRFEPRRPSSNGTPSVPTVSSASVQWRPVRRIVAVDDPRAPALTCTPGACTPADLDPSASIALSDRLGRHILVLEPVVVDASDVVAAKAVEIGATLPQPEWVVGYELDADGTDAFAEATREAALAEPPGNQIAIVVDGAVVSAPVVQEPITGGSGQIGGGFTEPEALALAELLNRASAAPSSSPTGSPTVAPEGEDIGLDVNWCDVQRLAGLDLVGDGPTGIVWTGYPVDAAGRCPRSSSHQAAVDVTGDGLPDASTDIPLVCEYSTCLPLGATDLDADGDEEIVVIAAGAVINHAYLGLRFDGDRVAIEPILVAEPGNPDAEINPGDPLVTSAAGDEGFSGWIRCEAYPADPVLVTTWSSAIVDSDEPVDWHETKLELRADGMFHVVAQTNLRLPPGEDPGFLRSEKPACGLDFRFW